MEHNAAVRIIGLQGSNHNNKRLAAAVTICCDSPATG